MNTHEDLFKDDEFRIFVELLNTLSPEAIFVVNLHVGITEDAKTFEYIAQIMKTNPEKVHEIYNESIKTLYDLAAIYRENR